MEFSRNWQTGCRLTHDMATCTQPNSSCTQVNLDALQIALQMCFHFFPLLLAKAFKFVIEQHRDREVEHVEKENSNISIAQSEKQDCWMLLNLPTCAGNSQSSL